MTASSSGSASATRARPTSARSSAALARRSLDTLETVLDAADVVELQEAAELVRADDSVVDYVLSIVTATRRSRLLALGVSPRGSLALLRAARAHALADGRDFLVPDDVKRLAVPALAHRVILAGPGAGRVRRGRRGDHPRDRAGRSGPPLTGGATPSRPTVRVA